MYAYGTGLTAYLTKIVVDNPLLLFIMIMRVPYSLFFVLSGRSTKNQQKSPHFPEELADLEKKGMLRGPFLYLKGWLKHRDKKSRLVSRAMKKNIAITYAE
jgi:O-antigen biosynthesis protein